MKSIIFTLLFAPIVLYSQEILFPTKGDGACSFDTEYGFPSGIPVYLNVDQIDTVFCSNGRIEGPNEIHHDYMVYPEHLGPLKVTLISHNQRFTSSVTVIERPQLAFQVTLQGDSIKVELVDQASAIVTDHYYSALELSIAYGNHPDFIFFISHDQWQDWIAIEDIPYPKDIDRNQPFRIRFNTTAIYSRKSCLFIGNCEYDLNHKPN